MPPTYHKVVDANEMLHKAPILRDVDALLKLIVCPLLSAWERREGVETPPKFLKRGGA